MLQSIVHFHNHRGYPKAVVGIFFTSLIGAAVAFWIAGFRLHSVPGPAGVFRFLAVFGSAFAMYGAALACLATLDRALSRSYWTGLIVVVAAVFRLLILPAGMSDGVTLTGLRDDVTGRQVVFDRFLLYDNDVWRYLWDGKQQQAGINPYRFAPAELEPYNSAVLKADHGLESRLFPSDAWRDIWENVGYKDIRTAYPPLMQDAFRLACLLCPGSVLCWKLLMVACDLGLCVATGSLLRVLERPAYHLAAYAWNPLVIKEVAGSGHGDVLVALLVVLALLALVRGRTDSGSGWLALGIMAKLSPVVLVPLMWRRARRRDRTIIATVIVLVAAPFAGAGGHLVLGLSSYSRDWIFNPGVFELARWLSMKALPGLDASDVAKLLCGSLYLGLLMVLLLRPDRDRLDLVRKWLVALGGLIFFSSAVMPWYLVWVLPLAAVCGCRSLLVYSGLCLLSYWVYIRGDGVEEPWRLLLIHGGFCIALAIEQLRSMRPALFQSLMPIRLSP